MPHPVKKWHKMILFEFLPPSTTSTGQHFGMVKEQPQLEAQVANGWLG